MPKSKRAKACDITQKVKKEVWERDKGQCILCGTNQAMPNAHYIPKSQNGKGMPENIVTLCMYCHRELDQTTNRKVLLEIVRDYLKLQYPEWNEEKLIYKKWGEI